MQKNKYIILFFTQYGAISYSKKLAKDGIENSTRPVPRSLSSSCGICVQAETQRDLMLFLTEDVEKLCIEKDGGYQTLYENEEQ
ncbi:MAG: DUF3343 domain-containing protein [Peptostreptococcaceae bacterium]|nr:DUF3343 domain-containing protein [Peptostreptococcaceae bacterium]